MPPLRDRRSSLHQHDVRGKPQNLVELMTDINHRNGELVAQQLEVGQDFLAPLAIERRQGLIEQQEARLRKKRSGDGNPLTLAARESVHSPRHERRELEQGGGLIEGNIARSLRAALGVMEIGGHVQMREQSRILEHISDAALFRWNIDAVQSV